MARIEDVRVGAKFIIEAEVAEINKENQLIMWNEYKKTGMNQEHWISVNNICIA